MATKTPEPTTDPVLEKLREAIGTTHEITIRKKTGNYKVLNVRESKTGFAFDFTAKPATVMPCYEYRFEDLVTGRKFWSPPFSAKLKEKAK